MKETISKETFNDGTESTVVTPLNGELITAEDYEAEERSDGSSTVVVEDWEEQLQLLANKDTKTLRIPSTGDMNRKRVVNAFMNAFELIGGTPRLALWANDNPKEFYKLYSRLLPSQASSALGESNEMVVRHVLPRGELDQ